MIILTCSTSLWVKSWCLRSKRTHVYHLGGCWDYSSSFTRSLRFAPVFDGFAPSPAPRMATAWMASLDGDQIGGTPMAMETPMADACISNGYMSCSLGKIPFNGYVRWIFKQHVTYLIWVCKTMGIENICWWIRGDDSGISCNWYIYTVTRRNMISVCLKMEYVPEWQFKW